MFEMAVSCKYHGNVVLIAKRDGLVVANGTSGLYNGGDACFWASSTESAKGKKASEAITAPFRSNSKDPALLMACLRASTRDVRPTPLAMSCLFLASTMALDLECFTILLANSKSSISCALGAVWVTLFRSSAVSVLVSRS